MMLTLPFAVREFQEYRMSDDHADHPTKGRLQDLQAALFELRDELQRLSLAMQEYVLLSDDRMAASVRTEAADLIRRAQRSA